MLDNDSKCLKGTLNTNSFVNSFKFFNASLIRISILTLVQDSISNRQIFSSNTGLHKDWVI